jgi:chromosome segregation ATPase
MRAPSPGPQQSDAGTAPAEVREQVSVLTKELEEAAHKFERLQSALATQQQLEQLLRQGRAHLQDLGHRLQQMTAERDRLLAELGDRTTAHRLELEQVQSEVNSLRRQLETTAGRRDSLATQLEEREAAHQQFAAERTEERDSFERLLAEARSNERDMVAELDEQRQQCAILREAALRAQALARQIMNAQEPTAPD